MQEYLDMVWKHAVNSLHEKFHQIPHSCLIIREMDNESFLIYDNEINMIVRTPNKYERRLLRND